LRPFSLEYLIKPLEESQWEGASEIYRQGLMTGQATFETAVPDFNHWDASHLSFGRIAAVSRSEQRLIGWAALSPVSKRPAYAGVAEVSVYVSENARGKGVGHALLQALIGEAEQNGIWTLQASIFPENEASLRLHESLGFRVIGKRERISQLKGVWRDTLLLERRSTVVGTE
jgi:phosphinothricin acetyltransferase